MADSRENYGATGAPLVVNDLVISGVSGGRQKASRISRRLSRLDGRTRLAVLDGACAGRSSGRRRGVAARSSMGAPRRG